MTPDPAATLQRRDVHPSAIVDGRPLTNAAAGRISRHVQQLLISKGEREEAEIEQHIRLPGVTRPNTVALISPKGGVGKTTSTFVVGNLLATHLKLRVVDVAVDANPDFATLGRLAADTRRCDHSLADLLAFAVDRADRRNVPDRRRSHHRRRRSRRRPRRGRRRAGPPDCCARPPGSARSSARQCSTGSNCGACTPVLGDER